MADPFAYTPLMPQQTNLPQAEAAMNLSPQEQALYMRHVLNMLSPGGVNLPGGARASLMQIGVGANGREYNIPSVYEGRIVPVPEAMDRARAQGLDKFPSYNTVDEAEGRYQQMHDYMDRDVGDFKKQGILPPVDPAEEAVMKVIDNPEGD